jgi:hypothetical protein
MRPQKSKRFRNNNIHARQKVYTSIDCLRCVHWKGRKKGCPFRLCAYDSEKPSATNHGRIKRKGGDAHTICD